MLRLRWRADLITKTLRRNDRDFIADALVGFEVEGKLGIVTFDDDLGGFLHGLPIVSTSKSLLCHPRVRHTFVRTRPMVAVLQRRLRV